MSKVAISGACPTFFRAQCREASNGTGPSFAEVGRGFARAILKLAPNDQEDHEWAEEVEGLADLIGERQDAEVLAWLDLRLPRCMQLVPEEARVEFLDGLYQAVFEDEVDISVD